MDNNWTSLWILNKIKRENNPVLNNIYKYATLKQGIYIVHTARIIQIPYLNNSAMVTSNMAPLKNLTQAYLQNVNL